jgi:hypothetical protein
VSQIISRSRGEATDSRGLQTGFDDVEPGEPPLDGAEQEQGYSGEDDRDLKG